MESHSYTNTASMPSGEYGGDPQDVVGRHLGEESGREGASGYATNIQKINITLKDCLLNNALWLTRPLASKTEIASKLQCHALLSLQDA